jgi:hypothetical protein
MKKSYIIILLVLFDIISFSQENKFENEHYIGIQISANISSLFLIYETDGVYYPPNPYFKTISGGISYKNFSERYVGLSIDLNYIPKKGNLVFNINTDGTETLPVVFTYTADYIEFTPLMNIRMGKKRTRVNLYAGFHTAHSINNTLKPITETYGQVFKTTIDNKFEFGLNAGTGYSFNFKTSTVEIRLMYAQGLTNVFDPETSTKYLWFNQNQVFSASILYYFKLLQKN